MNLEQIIKIEKSKGGKNIVNARDVWRGLESKQDFSNWIKNKLLPNFDYNKDYSIIEYDVMGAEIRLNKISESENQKIRVHKRDYPITLNTAEHLAMMENTVRGKKVRQFFIDKAEELDNLKNTQQVPTTFSQALKLAYEQSVKLELQDAKIKEDAPKVAFAEAIQESEGLILIRDLAKLLKQKGADTGEKKLYKWMRTNGFLTQKNTPTQRSVTLQVLELVENVYNDDEISFTTKVTGKGQVYFMNKFLRIKNIKLK